MTIDSIRNGVVIDHIPAGKALEIYRHLHMDKLNCSVAILTNVSSEKLGRKDIIKIDEDIELNWDVIGYLAQELPHVFRLVDEKKGLYRCIYCESKA